MPANESFQMCIFRNSSGKSQLHPWRWSQMIKSKNYSCCSIQCLCSMFFPYAIAKPWFNIKFTKYQDRCLLTFLAQTSLFIARKKSRFRYITFCTYLQEKKISGNKWNSVNLYCPTLNISTNCRIAMEKCILTRSVCSCNKQHLCPSTMRTDCVLVIT